MTSAFLVVMSELIGRKVLACEAQLQKQNGTSRENSSTKGLGHYDKCLSCRDVGVDWAESSGLRSSTTDPSKNYYTNCFICLRIHINLLVLPTIDLRIDPSVLQDLLIF